MPSLHNFQDVPCIKDLKVLSVEMDLGKSGIK
jgi:hypothetical protein